MLTHSFGAETGFKRNVTGLLTARILAEAASEDLAPPAEVGPAVNEKIQFNSLITYYDLPYYVIRRDTRIRWLMQRTFLDTYSLLLSV